MGLDRKLDPITGDYVDDGAGGWAYVSTIETEVRHEVLDRRGKWIDAYSGSGLLDHMETATLSDRDVLLAKRHAEVALQRFVDEGRASDLVVVAQREGDRVLVTIEIHDVQSNEVIAIPLPAIIV